MMIAAGLPIVSHPSRAVLQDYPRNLLSTGRGIAGGRVPEAEGERYTMGDRPLIAALGGDLR